MIPLLVTIAMPPEVSVPSEDNEDDVAFKVLNKDNLPISIVGEQIFKPFGRENQKEKPNGIVYPTRRVITNLDNEKQKEHAKSNGFINNIQEVEDLKAKRKLSKSHGNLHHTNSAVKLRPPPEVNNFLEDKFTKTLDAKLRKLQKDEKLGKKFTNGSTKKPFVTTVKTGTFLEPEVVPSYYKPKVENEPEVKTKNLYSFFSQPRVLNRTSAKTVHRSKCEAAASAAFRLASGVAGVDKKEIMTNEADEVDQQNSEMTVPYANLMFERRVVRGTNFGPTHMPKWNPHFAYARLLSQGDGESGAARAAEARRRAAARKRAKRQTSNFHLGSPPPMKGRKHEPVQTDLYLEEIFVDPPVTEMCTQTELFLDRPISPFYVPAKTGEDAETQIYPGDLFDFDMEVQPIIETLVGKTVEQALIEVLEEEEIAAIREQQRKFMEKRAAEACEAQRILEREKRLVKEKERRVKDYEEGIKIQKEMEERIAASVLMQGYMADLLPSVLEGLENEGVLFSSIKEDINCSFMPWLVNQVAQELHEIVSSRDILSDIVREICENKSEIYHALHTIPPPELMEPLEEEGAPPDDVYDSEKLRELLYNESKRDSATPGTPATPAK